MYIIPQEMPEGSFSFGIFVSPQMSAKRATLGKTLVTDLAFVRSLAGMSPSMLNEVLSGAERFTTEFADLRFLAGVYPNMRLHVLSPDQLAAHLARHLALARVSPRVFLVTVTVEGLEATDLALVLFPRVGPAVNLHVATEVDSIAEGLVADLASAWLLLRVHAHVSPQGRLQVEALVANLAEFRKLLVVPPDVNPQVILGRQFRATHVTNVRSAMQRLVHVQVSLLLEDLVALVAFDGTGRSLALLSTSLDLPDAVFPV